MVSLRLMVHLIVETWWTSRLSSKKYLRNVQKNGILMARIFTNLPTVGGGHPSNTASLALPPPPPPLKNPGNAIVEKHLTALCFQSP